MSPDEKATLYIGIVVFIWLLVASILKELNNHKYDLLEYLFWPVMIPIDICIVLIKTVLSFMETLAKFIVRMFRYIVRNIKRVVLDILDVIGMEL